jgi:hypothetical protein
MAISAAPAFEGTAPARSSFSAAIGFSDKPLNLKDSAPVPVIEGRVGAANDNITHLMGAIYDARERLVMKFGLADTRGQSANMLNPALDGLLFMGAVANPAFAPVASALAMADVLNYIKADRKGRKKSVTPEVRIFDVDWGNTGYFTRKPANTNRAPEKALTEDQRLALSRDPAQDPHMQDLFAEKARAEGVMASIRRREKQGLPLSRNTAGAVLAQDSVWLRRNMSTPVPGHI